MVIYACSFLKLINSTTKIASDKKLFERIKNKTWDKNILALKNIKQPIFELSIISYNSRINNIFRSVVTYMKSLKSFEKYTPINCLFN